MASSKKKISKSVHNVIIDAQGQVIMNATALAECLHGSFILTFMGSQTWPESETTGQVVLGIRGKTRILFSCDSMTFRHFEMLAKTLRLQKAKDGGGMLYYSRPKPKHRQYRPVLKPPFKLPPRLRRLEEIIK